MKFTDGVYGYIYLVLDLVTGMRYIGKHKSGGKMNQSIIRLFHAVSIDKHDGKAVNKKLLSETVKKGFIFAPEVTANYSEKELFAMINIVADEVGLSSDKMNSSFHKSWQKVRDADIEQLVLEQILHYITTYGFEAMGIYRNDSIYIPLEDLKIPKLNLDKISLVVIKGYTKEELKEKLINLLGSGIALKEDTKKDVIDIITFVGLNENEVYNIKNKEVRAALYDYMDICPMPEDYLNSITALLKHGVDIDKDNLMKELGRVNTFRKIRLAYALKYRTNDNDGVVVDSILYRIRNGKSYATGFDLDDPKGIIFRNTVRILDIVLDSMVDDIRPNVEGKKICIPKNIQYALPTTEKQFTGDFPSGTYVSFPKDAIVGVHWGDVDSNRIDLDLSLIRCDGGKIGWDASYRSKGGDTLFSGDMTAAPKPNGASELFYIQRQTNASYILMVNYFNYDQAVPVPFKIIVASEQVNKVFGHNYMINPNNIVCVAKSKMTEKQKVLGLLVTTPDECRFYFAEANMGNSITSDGNTYTEQARKYLFDFYTNTISFNDILRRAGAVLVGKQKDCDIDLSYETLEKDSLIKLITK